MNKPIVGLRFALSFALGVYLTTKRRVVWVVPWLKRTV